MLGDKMSLCLNLSKTRVVFALAIGLDTEDKHPGWRIFTAKRVIGHRGTKDMRRKPRVCAGFILLPVCSSSRMFSLSCTIHSAFRHWMRQSFINFWQASPPYAFQQHRSQTTVPSRILVALARLLLAVVIWSARLLPQLEKICYTQ